MACFDCAKEKTNSRLEELAMVYIQVFKAYENIEEIRVIEIYETEKGLRFREYDKSNTLSEQTVQYIFHFKRSIFG